MELAGLKPYAHVVDGKVVNTSVWDGVSDYTPRDGATMVPLPTFTDDEGVDRYYGGIGWDYTDGEFVDNRPTDEPDDAGL
jgi:hypothetical protein